MFVTNNVHYIMSLNHGSSHQAPDGFVDSAVERAVKAGLFLQGARLAARRDSPFGISGSPSEQGEIRLLAQLDPDFKTSLKPLRREWWAR